MLGLFFMCFFIRRDILLGAVYIKNNFMKECPLVFRLISRGINFHATGNKKSDKVLMKGDQYHLNLAASYRV
ncbi:hypothetical protein EDD76_108115 [Kineothrix alysoides]|uniref:Uncharacterized protein n=1 Tax=Kineothrix alysoides TaxID=1469948 RepID=A0A4R1QYH2_9FIRM|nr:hypothetical protein EDD76_108115 [Kineothrix alysoides]